MLCALLGFLGSFLLLEKAGGGYSYGWSNELERFFKWLKYSHSNEYVLVVCPLIAVLLGWVVFRFIDYSRPSAADESGVGEVEGE